MDRNWFGSRCLFALAVAAILLPADAAEAQRRRGRDNDNRDRQRRENQQSMSDAQRRALETLDEEINGKLVYGRNDRIRVLKIGERESTDLGEGESARWSPDGTKLAVYNEGDIFVMDADGGNRKRLFDDADDLEDGCAIEFHTNGKEIICVKRRSGFWSVPIDGGEATRLDLPGRYTGEPGVSADAKRMVARLDNDLYAVDLEADRHRKFARGCAPCLSPDGQWTVNNIGSHRTLAVQRWDGKDRRRLDARILGHDRGWDDFHWSNHPNYIALQGEDRGEEAYVVDVFAEKATRVTWEGRVRMPDLFVEDVADPSPAEIARSAR